MFEFLANSYDQFWRPLPKWVKWTVVVWLVLSVDAGRMAWGEHRFVGGYFEALLADFIYVGIPILAFVLGIFGGTRAFEKSNSKIVGWVVGFAIALAIYGVRVGAEKVPGVGWRIQAMQEAHDFAQELD